MDDDDTVPATLEGIAAALAGFRTEVRAEFRAIDRRIDAVEARLAALPDTGLLQRHQRQILDEMRVLKDTAASKSDVTDLQSRITGLYNAYGEMARGISVALHRSQEHEDRIAALETKS